MDVNRLKSNLGKRLLPVLPENVADVMAPAFVDTILESQEGLAKTSDLLEIKQILLQLVAGQAELTASHHRLEARVDGIQEDVTELKQDMKEVKDDVFGLKTDVAGLKQDMTEVKDNIEELNVNLEGVGWSMGYAMENEAYRALPAFLRQFGIDITEKFIRTKIAGEEINFLARGTREGREVLVVGEAALRMNRIGKKIRRLARKVQAARQSYPDTEIVRMLVTHFAPPHSIARAREKGILVAQSFEW